MSEFNLQGVSPQSLIAGGTILANRVVELSAANTVTAADAIADVAFGVALVGAVVDEVVPVQQFGKAKITASAAIAAGAQVMVTAAGAGKVSTLAGATARSIGQAITAAGADGDIVEVQLMLSGSGPAAV